MSNCARPFGRTKLGEIFHVENNGYEFTCGHCLYDFKQFAEFNAHVQEYLEEMIAYERRIKLGNEIPLGSVRVIDGDMAQQLVTEELPVDFDNDSQESRDIDESDIELVNESNARAENVSNAEHSADEDVVYVVIGDDDSDNNVIEDDDGENEYAALFNDDDEDADDDLNVNDEIENELDEDGTNAPLHGGYKCPLCQSCYSTIEFLQMHLNNYHSKSTIYSYLAVATTNPSDKVNHIKLSKRLEDLPTENILLEDSPEAAEYSKYLFDFRFEKTASGSRKCPKCNYTGVVFKVKNHVFTHLKTKLFNCLICKQKFNTLAKSRKHMRKIHLCTWCVVDAQIS